jgi:hypothetical protein
MTSNDVYTLLVEVRTNCGHGFGALTPPERELAQTLAEAYLYSGELLTQPQWDTLKSFVLRVKKANEVQS